jgi:hypothetical protein
MVPALSVFVCVFPCLSVFFRAHPCFSVLFRTPRACFAMVPALSVIVRVILWLRVRPSPYGDASQGMLRDGPRSFRDCLCLSVPQGHASRWPRILFVAPCFSVRFRARPCFSVLFRTPRACFAMAPCYSVFVRVFPYPKGMLRDGPVSFRVRLCYSVAPFCAIFDHLYHTPTKLSFPLLKSHHAATRPHAILQPVLSPSPNPE